MNEIREDLKAYLDGELPPERAEVIRLALDKDASLRDEVETMRMLGLEIRRLANEPVPVGAEAASDRLVRRKPKFILTAVALCGLIVFAGFWARQGVYAQSKESALAAAVSGEDASVNKRDFATSSASPPPETLQDGAVEGLGSGRESIHGQDNRSLDRMLVKTANIEVQVQDPAEAQSRATDLAKSLGGFSSTSNLSTSSKDVPIATITIRIPSRSFEQAIKTLASYGKRLSLSMSGDDVTAEFVDVVARIRALKAEEEGYVTMLRAARKVGEMLEIKERLGSVRQQIESIEGQRQVLADQSAFSTITATFSQVPQVGSPAADKDWASSSWADAVNGLKSAGIFLGQGVIFLFVYSPVWIPILIFAWWLNKRTRRS